MGGVLVLFLLVFAIVALSEEWALQTLLAIVWALLAGLAGLSLFLHLLGLV